MSASHRARLVHDLGVALIRVRSGLTLGQALRDAAPLKADPSVCLDWIRVRDAILEGRLGADAGLSALVERLQMEERLEADLRRCTAQPRAQALVIASLTIFFGAYQSLAAPAFLRPTGSVWLFALPMLGIGLWLTRLLTRRVRRHLWLADWVLYLRRIECALRWGESLPSALARASEPPMTWPQRLQASYLSLRNRLMRGEAPSDLIDATARGEREADTAQALETLDCMERLFHEGHGVGPLLKACLESAQSQLSDRLAIEAERLRLVLLAPLFCCFLPAFAVFLAEPLFRATWERG